MMHSIPVGQQQGGQSKIKLFSSAATSCKAAAPPAAASFAVPATSVVWRQHQTFAAGPQRERIAPASVPVPYRQTRLVVHQPTPITTTRPTTAVGSRPPAATSTRQVVVYRSASTSSASCSAAVPPGATGPSKPNTTTGPRQNAASVPVANMNLLQHVNFRAISVDKNPFERTRRPASVPVRPRLLSGAGALSVAESTSSTAPTAGALYYPEQIQTTAAAAQLPTQSTLGADGRGTIVQGVQLGTRKTVSASDRPTVFADAISTRPTLLNVLPTRPTTLLVDGGGLEDAPRQVETGPPGSEDGAAVSSASAASSTVPIGPELALASEGRKTIVKPVPNRATGATLGSSSGSTAATRSGPPKGTGPLFQCAVCAGLVYESQLEYHMTICKEPEDAPVLEKVEPAPPAAKEQRASSLSAQSVDRGTSPAKPAANHGPPNKATSSPAGTLGSARRQLQLDPPLEVEQQRRDREQDTRPPTVLSDRDTRARLPTTSTENDRNSTDTQEPPTTNPMIPASPSSPVPPAPAFVAGAGTTASLRPHRGKEMDRVTRENIKQHSAKKWRLQREQYKAQGEAHELAECTFRPRHVVEHKLLNTSTLAASSYYSPGSVVIGEQQLSDALMKTSAPTLGEIKPASRGRTTANHRTKRELEQYRQEKYEKEMKECTFRPIVNSELNRYILAESAANLFSDPENYLENEQERKKKKLFLIEKEAYRECTHKPTISDYAQKHSKGGHNHRTGAEDLVERGEQENVHDRLYSAYTIAQTAKTGLLEELMSSSTIAVVGAAGGEEGGGGARGKRAGTSKQQRSGSKGKRSGSDEGGGAGAAAAKNSGGASNAGKKASNLLYSDAVARQKKRKEQTADQGKMPHSPGRVCSARSRRYYWHLLEKKVREAFQVAVAAKEDHTSAPGELHFTDLPLFLEEMGCVERRAGARGAAAGTNIDTGRNKDDGDDKRNQLHLSLWRVLDPEARGCTDLLALTVFFHVLMGAVDDDTFKSLQQGHAGDSSADSDADVEAQRIRGLVSQYDPQKLRQEFGLFYFNRLHNTSRSGGPLTAPSGPPGGSCATAEQRPGQGLSNKVTQRLKEESGVMTHVDLLLWRQKKNQEKLQKQRTEKEEREKKEAREMQFFQRRGKKNSKEQQVVEVDVQTRAAGTTRGRKPSARAKGKGKGAYSTPQERTVDGFQAVQVLTSSSLYERGMHQKEKLAENVKIAQQLQQDRELAACSFKPNVEVVAHAANAGATNVRGYEETTSRMRRAFDAKSELRRWQETRAPRTDKKASSVAALREMKKRVFSPPSRANKKEDHVEDEGEEEAVVMREKEHAGARAGGGRGGAGGARGRAPKMSNYYTSEEEHYVQPGPARAQHGAATMKSSSSANSYNRSRRRIMEVVDHDHAETDHNEQEQEEFVDFLSRSAAPAKALPQSQNQKFRPRPRSTSGGPRKNLHAAYQALGQSRRRRRAAESDEDENALLYVDVNISPTETDRLVVYRGQKPHEAAKKFAEKHGLSGHLTKKLNYLLAVQLENLSDLLTVSQG